MAPLDVNKEAVRLLVVEHGVTETAKQTGIPLNTLLSWSARGKWLKKAEPPKLPATVQPRAINAIQPSTAQANMLEQKKNKTRSNLAKFLVNASTVALRSRKPLQDAGMVKDVAQIYSRIYPEEGGNKGLTLNLGVAVSGMQ